MGQAVAVANASGDRLYVKVQSSVQLSEKTDVTVGGSTPAAAVEATGKVDVEVSEFLIKPFWDVAIPDSAVGARGRYGGRKSTYGVQGQSLGRVTEATPYAEDRDNQHLKLYDRKKLKIHK